MLEAEVNHRLGDFTLDVDMNLDALGVCAVFGPSGCGKTTLLKTIAGLLPAQGRIYFKGQCWQDQHTWVKPYQRSTGFVFQDNRLFPNLNVSGNLAFARQRAADGGIDYEDVIETLGVRPLLHRAVAKLSGGEAKRVAIARTLLSQPRLLLMDEPLNGLEQKSKQEILGYLRRLIRRFELPTLYVSHNIEEVARLCDQMLVMDSGRVIAHGDTATMLQSMNQSRDSDLDPLGAVVYTTVSAHRPEYSLTQLDLAGHSLYVPMQSELTEGQTMQLFLPARDIALATTEPRGLSIRNSLPGEVETLQDEANNRVRVAINVAGQMLFAQITRQASEALNLHRGQRVFALIKSVALD